MMKYERLTIRNSDGSVSQPTHSTFEKVFNRLAELEDKIENGTFIELPCNSGDSFFAIVGKSVREYEIEYIKICKKNKVRLISTESIGFDLGKDAFLTKPEAEKKLKELQ